MKLIVGAKLRQADTAALAEILTTLTAGQPGPHTLYHGDLDKVAVAAAKSLGWQTRLFEVLWTRPCEPDCPQGHRRPPASGRVEAASTQGRRPGHRADHMSITAIRNYTCTECHQPLTDRTSRLFRLGPDRRKTKTDAELAEALRRTREAADPFHIPAEKAPSRRAQVVNAAARRVVEAAAAPDVCERHGGVRGSCAECRYEDEHPVERILRDITGLPMEERRAIRVEVLAARYHLDRPVINAERSSVPVRHTVPDQPSQAVYGSYGSVQRDQGGSW